jgi:hypothetical protein
VTSAPAGSLLEYLQQITDPRGRQGRRHALSAMLATVVCAVLSGARGFTAIAQWLLTRSTEELHLLGYTRTPPTANAFRDLLLALDPEAFDTAILQWTADGLSPQSASSADSTESGSPTELEALGLDGKTLRGTLVRHKRAIHLLSLFSHDRNLTLAQTPVPETTNEPTAATEWLRSIVLRGKVITADAIFCQRDFCQQVLDSGGHYFVAVKDNQPTLKADIAAEFQAAFSPGERSPASRAS